MAIEEGSGTGELAGIKGEGRFRAPEGMEGTIEHDNVTGTRHDARANASGAGAVAASPGKGPGANPATTARGRGCRGAGWRPPPATSGR